MEDQVSEKGNKISMSNMDSEEKKSNKIFMFLSILKSDTLPRSLAASEATFFSFFFFSLSPCFEHYFA